MKILITGGNGNLAKIIKNNLSSEFDITCITRNDFDLLDEKSLSNYLNNNSFQILIHTAITGGRRTKEDNGDMIYKNLLMFENLIKFSNKFQIIINFDSGAIYDRSTDINCRKEEELNTIPNDYYGFSKYLIYQRSLQYNNIVNFRIFNIFHKNEENDRFIKSCFLAKKNNRKITIFQDKFFDFVYEDDFIKIIKYYIKNYSHKLLPKTINISYSTKYKLSEIAEIILNDKNLIEIIDSNLNNNYCGNGDLLMSLNLNLNGLKNCLIKYEEQLNCIL